MVRLKEGRGGQVRGEMVRFNSTMVRLKVGRLECLRLPYNLFQFHNGSIKGRIPLPSTFRVHTFQFHNGSIKGIMVRLTISLTGMFQFHNGSIKGAIRDDEGAIADCFNSTMVRLKVIHKAVIKAKRFRFQFHNGSIKGCPEGNSTVIVPMFQFHNGSIKGNRYHLR